jgi:hypothetical protein
VADRFWRRKQALADLSTRDDMLPAATVYKECSTRQIAD